MLCTDEIVLKNVLTGLNESKKDYLEAIKSNRSLKYAAYKHFTWWVFNYVDKENRRVIFSSAL